jgi:acylphosphatase
MFLEGRVQGVGFRYFALKSARKLGLGGWVRNEDDGSVSCEAQGDEDSVREFEGLLRRGPRFSSVDRVLVETVDLDGDPTGTFEIR